MNFSGLGTESYPPREWQLHAKDEMHRSEGPDGDELVGQRYAILRHRLPRALDADVEHVALDLALLLAKSVCFTSHLLFGQSRP